MDKIFVQLASYRDPQLIPTIEDMLEKADNPKMFTFGICWQHDETEDITKYDKKKNYRIKKYHYSESKGLGWARNITNSLYRGEPLVLQLDTHHRFAKGWDTMMLEDFKQAKLVSDKPVLTTYLTPFEVSQDPEIYEKSPCLMSQYEFSQDKLLMSRPYHIMDHKERTHVIRSRTISGHFLLAEGKFLEEVPYDPDIYFGGYTEETTLSVRAFTNGYDFFSPYRQYIWHEYTREGRPKHWEDHGIQSKTKMTSGERDIFARKKTRQLFGQEDNGIVFGEYGLGNVRTLHDYEVYGGFDFKNCRLQDYTLNVKEPPNPPDWENQFISTDYSIECSWDKEFFLKHNFDKPKLLTLGIQNSSDAEVHRKDFLIENDSDYLNFVKTSYLAKFKSIDKPSKIVMYLMDENNNWSERYEKSL
jgi:glycosyltransferase involved in cell wall biosynthesis